MFSIVSLGFNVQAVHLIAASVMSAPAAIGMAKLLYPEIQKSTLNKVEKIKFESA